MSSVAQLEVDISTYFHEGGGHIGPIVTNCTLDNSSLSHPVVFVFLSILVLDFMIKNMGTLNVQCQIVD